jgi:hypothetical protein
MSQFRTLGSGVSPFGDGLADRESATVLKELGKLFNVFEVKLIVGVPVVSLALT